MGNHRGNQLVCNHMATLIFTIVILHLVAGLGWVIYKIEFKQPTKNK